jgi:tetratricopeptide (TPR) repeat protein
LYSKRRIYRRNRKTFLIVFLFILPLFIHSQEIETGDTIIGDLQSLETAQSWLLYEKGLHLFEEKEYGAALNHFNKLVERHGVYPEAEYWIGRVFEKEGEFILAEKQYLKALEAVRVLHIPGDKYEIEYRLAELYKNREDFDSYSQILGSIVLDELAENQLAMANEESAVNTLKKEGIDRMLLLFRHKFTYSVDAFNQLGIFYYKRGNYRAATARLIFPVLSFFSISIDYLRELDPAFSYPEDFTELLEKNGDYVFDTLEKVIRRKNSDFSFVRNLETLSVEDREGELERAAALLPEDPEFYLSAVSCCLERFYKEQVLRELMEEYDIFRTLYYLGDSLFAEGYSESAQRIWEITAAADTAGMWQLRSLQQLENPQVETDRTIY